MDELLRRLEALDAKLTATQAAVERMRRYMLWTLIFNLVVFLLPLLALIIAVPMLLNAMSQNLSATGLL
mgnify:FL=1